MSDETYRRIFEAVNDALLLYELTGRPVAFNPAASRLFGYTGDEFQQIPTDRLIHPDSRHLFDHFGETISAGREFRTKATLVHKDGTAFTADVRGIPFWYNEQPHALSIIRDISQETAAWQLLDRRVADQTRQLSVLLEVSRNVAATLEIKPLLRLIIDQIRILVEFQSAGIFLVDGDDYYIPEYQGLGQVDGVLKLRFPRSRISTIAEVERQRKPVIIGDYWTDDPEAEPLAWAVRQAASPQEMAENPHALFRSWLGVPLMIKGNVIGILRLDHMEPYRFTENDARLVMAVAEQAAVAIENARLYEARQRRAEQFRIISEVGQRITSILALDELLSQTVRLIQEAFGYYHIHIGLIAEGYLTFKESAGVWWSNPFCHCCDFRVKVGEEGISGRVAASGEPILVPDVQKDGRYLPVAPDQSGSNVVLPLKVKGEVIGVLDVESERINAFDADDLIVLQLLANQIATAIENARLYEQAQQLAALQERQKLARELHDSVSQALYGIALGARTARVQLERDPAQAAEPVEYVLSLAEAGLAEMRALIFELRPESLATEGLAAALEKQAAALRTRHQMAVITDFCPEPDVSLEIKEALYRVTQEALHNVVKHARASRVDLHLQMENGTLTLGIRDNGRGFDPTASFPGHLGLTSMQERVERLGGHFSLASKPGQGVVVTAVLPLPAI